MCWIVESLARAPHQVGPLVFPVEFLPVVGARASRRLAAPRGARGGWTPRELRHSFVSLLSDSGVPLEEISQLVGHKSTAVTKPVYRKQIRPVLQSGAVAMDRIFDALPDPGHADSHSGH